MKQNSCFQIIINELQCKCNLNHDVPTPTSNLQHLHSSQSRKRLNNSARETREAPAASNGSPRPSRHRESLQKLPFTYPESRVKGRRDIEKRLSNANHTREATAA